jgi:transcription antitermination protein NusB
MRNDEGQAFVGSEVLCKHSSFLVPRSSFIVSVMAKRSKAREVALQVLYQDDVNPEEELADRAEFINSRLRDDQELIAFARSLIDGVRRNRSELDTLLAQTADNWSLERMAATDRNVMRLGAFEIIYTQTPGAVAINEAVELAKRFGTAQSAQFVNGILDKFIEGHQKK